MIFRMIATLVLWLRPVPRVLGAATRGSMVRSNGETVRNVYDACEHRGTALADSGLEWEPVACGASTSAIRTGNHALVGTHIFRISE